MTLTGAYIKRLSINFQKTQISIILTFSLLNAFFGIQPFSSLQNNFNISTFELKRQWRFVIVFQFFQLDNPDVLSLLKKCIWKAIWYNVSNLIVRWNIFSRFYCIFFSFLLKTKNVVTKFLVIKFKAFCQLRNTFWSPFHQHFMSAIAPISLRQ